MSIYIERIELNNYRSCKKTNAKLDPHLSALVGVNGSGKSNFLNGILLLKKIFRVSPRYSSGNEFLLSSCKLKVWFSVDGKVVQYDAVVQYTNSERNYDEVVKAEEKWNFKEITGHNIWWKFPLSFSRDHDEFVKFSGFPKELEENKNFIKQFMGFQIPEQIEVRAFIQLMRRISTFIAGINYYSASQFTDPSKSPTSFEIEDNRLSRRTRLGEHFQFIYDIYSAFKKDPNRFAQFLSFVNKEGVGLIDTIDFPDVDIPTSGYQVFTGGRLVQKKEVKKLLVIPTITILGIKLSPNQLSEGTFKTLAIVFYLMTDESRLLLLEEPEVCVHHGLLASVIELIKSLSREKQIIISTHSDYVLDALEPNNVFVVKNDEQKGTTVNHIPRYLSARDYKALKEYLHNSGNLGEYWRNGELER